MRRLLPLLVLCAACNRDPGYPSEQVGYRDVIDSGPSSGERGNVIISEILWSGSIKQTDSGYQWDPTDVFVELRNQGSLPVDVTDWYLQETGSKTVTWRLPDIGHRIEVGDHVFFAAKSTGCFPNADGYVPGLAFPDNGDPFELTLRDADERLMEPVGSTSQPPYAGGYDLVVSRSMERIQLLFGQSGTKPEMWHYYTNDQPVDVPNNDRMDPACQARTLASPGRPNSPDYSGAYASGSLD